MTATPRPDVSVVIPTRDRPDSLRRVLAGLAAQELDGIAAELVIADNGSTPENRRDLERALAAFEWPHELLALPHANISVARNSAVEAAQASLILFTNDDVVPARPDWLAGHVAAHTEDAREDRAVLGPVVWAPDRPCNRVMRWLSDTGMSHSYDGWENGGARPEAIYANNLSMHRAPYEAIGGFDPRLGRYGWGEYDLTLRLLDHGLDVAYRADLLGYHDHYHSLAYSLERMRKQGRAAVVFNEIHAGRAGLMTPHPSRWKVTLGCAAAPVATRVPIPDRLPRRVAEPLLWFAHQCALAEGFREEHRRGWTPVG